MAFGPHGPRQAGSDVWIARHGRRRRGASSGRPGGDNVDPAWSPWAATRSPTPRGPSPSAYVPFVDRRRRQRVCARFTFGARATTTTRPGRCATSDRRRPRGATSTLIAAQRPHSAPADEDGRGNETAPNWSPDGRRVASHQRGGAVWIVGAAGGRPRRVILSRAGGRRARRLWSPDGKRNPSFLGGPAASSGGSSPSTRTPRRSRRSSAVSGRTDGRWPDWQPARLTTLQINGRRATSRATRPGPVLQRRRRRALATAASRRTGNLLLRRRPWERPRPWATTQYSNGDLRLSSLQSYDPTWGPSRSTSSAPNRGQPRVPDGVGA